MKFKIRSIWAQKLLVVLFLTAVSFVAYLKVFKGFFQQDEWLAFGFHFLIRNEGINSLIKNAFILRTGHYSPLNLLFEQLLFENIGLNYMGWAGNSIFLHIVNVLLVFVIANQILSHLFPCSLDP